jgi:hypothetical protein
MQCFCCERVATKKGMCHAHYMRARRGSRLDVPLPPQIGLRCSAIGCDRLASERDMCHSHARRVRRGASVYGAIHDRRGDWPATCMHDGCSRPSHTRGLCKGHYSRLLNPPKLGTYRFWESGLSREWWRALRRMAKGASPRQLSPWDKWIYSRRASFSKQRPEPTEKVRRDRSTWRVAIRAMCQSSLREAWRARRDPWDRWCERRVMSFGRRRSKCRGLAKAA